MRYDVVQNGTKSDATMVIRKIESCFHKKYTYMKVLSRNELSLSVFFIAVMAQKYLNVFTVAEEILRKTN